jgi:hypothetical protein
MTIHRERKDCQLPNASISVPYVQQKPKALRSKYRSFNLPLSRSFSVSPKLYRSNKHHGSKRNTHSKDQLSSYHHLTQLRNSLAQSLTCRSISFDRPSSLGRHALYLIVAALVVKTFGQADVIARTSIHGEAHVLPLRTTDSGRTCARRSIFHHL